jgi:hypothetical protein
MTMLQFACVSFVAVVASGAPARAQFLTPASVRPSARTQTEDHLGAAVAMDEVTAVPAAFNVSNGGVLDW